MNDPTQQPGIRIDQLILERASFEHSADFLSHPPSTQITLDELEISLEGGTSPDGNHGLIRMHVRTNQKSPAYYVFDVTMTALLSIDAAHPNMQLPEYFATSGAALLYPFMRETVASITGRGRFGPLWLRPLNLTQVKINLAPRDAVQAARPRAVAR